MLRAGHVVGAALAVGLTAGSGCSGRQAEAEFRSGNLSYLADDFPAAIAHYEKAVALEPDRAEVRFYLANAHHALADEIDFQDVMGTPAGTPVEPAAREARILENLRKAATEYAASASSNGSATPALAAVKRQTLECLARIHARGPLRDPDKAAGYARELRPLLADDASSARLVGELLREADRAEEAVQLLRETRARYPEDPAVCRTLAAAVAAPGLDQTARFEEAIGAYESCAALEPQDPAGPRALAMAFWSRGYRDIQLADHSKVAYAERGLTAADRALALDPQDVEALIARSLLLRLKASWVGDPSTARALVQQADATRQEALEVRRRRAESGTP